MHEKNNNFVTGHLACVNLILGEVTLPSGWPRRGDIVFQQVSLRYDVTLHPVIKEVSLKVSHGQKVDTL